MTTPPTIDLAIYKGDDFRRVLQFTLNGAPADISLWTDLHAQMRRAPGAEALVEFTVQVESAGNGLVSVSLGRDVTATLEATRWVWDLQRVEGGLVRTVVRGRVTVTPDVTRVEV